MNRQQNYDPMGQAMQALQVLGNRKAQQQGFQVDQQRLALEAQRMAQQGDQFDRGLGMEGRSLDQRGSQFDQQHALALATQQAFNTRNAMMDPADLEYKKMQIAAGLLANSQAPARFAMDQGRYMTDMARVPMEHERQAQGERALKLNENAQKADMLKQMYPDLIDPKTYQPMVNPEYLARLMEMMGIQPPMGPPRPPVNQQAFGKPQDM